MGIWDRKNALDLCYAVQTFIRKNDAKSEHNITLEEIQRDLGKAASLPEFAESDLMMQRLRICEVCRGNGLYKCKVDVGWTESCAFLKSNRE